MLLTVTVSCPPAAMLPLAGLSRKPPPLSNAVHDNDVPPMLATVNWVWVTARRVVVVRVMVVGETDMIGRAGVSVAVGTGVGDVPAEGDVPGAAGSLGLGDPVGVGRADVRVDVLLTGVLFMIQPPP